MSFISPSLLWRSGALLTTAGIVAGAFGSHGLRKKLDADRFHAWETASHYAIFNGLALLLIAMHPRFGYHRFAGPAILIGGTVFSGTIVGLVLNREKMKWLGPITPMGGTLMIAGYLSLAL